jgi:hypothetical protein
MGFLVSIQSARVVVFGVAVDEGSLQALLEIPLAHSPHGDFSNLQRLGDGIIIPPGSIGAAVGLEQNARVGQLASWRLAGADELGQLGSLYWGQSDDSFRSHGTRVQSHPSQIRHCRKPVS